MSYRQITIHILMILNCFFYLSCSHASAKTPKILIEPTTLEKQTHLPNTVVIDLRLTEKFELGHIPNAINIPMAIFHREKDGVQGFVLTPNTFKSLIESYGIRNNDNIILYSDSAFLEAARAYWAFNFYGHEKVQILNGGFQAWQAKKLPISEDMSYVRQPSNYIIQVKPEKLATKIQTLVAGHNQNDYVIVDARPTKQYNGEESQTDRKGRIPESISIPWHEIVTNRDENNVYDYREQENKLVDWESLQKTLNHVPKDKKIILYCNGGQESSILYLGFKQLGIDTAVYDGSWFEWSADKKLPIETSIKK